MNFLGGTMNKNALITFFKICLTFVVMILGVGSILSRARCESEQSVRVDEKISVTVIYDNYQINPDLTSSWGFSCVIKTPQNNILFDTGGNSSILLDNMQKMAIAASEIDLVIISHIHGDHLGGLNGFLKKNNKVKVYIPISFPSSVREEMKFYGVEYHDVKSSMQICENVYTTGEMGIRVKEQALIIDTDKGLVIITGCAHPGIVEIIKESRQILTDRKIYLVIGGFHLSGASDSKLAGIVKEFRNNGVQKVAPSHCSGDRCRELFKNEYQADFIESGAGKIFNFQEPN
jgi:7,8-dihydropterin-6-yl-methyl-4-(beta-D-ribofuranosyl)aminobenzene 5'-phosphate synthase